MNESGYTEGGPRHFRWDDLKEAAGAADPMESDTRFRARGCAVGPLLYGQQTCNTQQQYGGNPKMAAPSPVWRGFQRYRAHSRDRAEWSVGVSDCCFA
jgi:hypothetical protein